MLSLFALTTYGKYVADNYGNGSDRLGQFIKFGIEGVSEADPQTEIEGIRFVSRGYYLGDPNAENELSVEGSLYYDFESISTNEAELNIDYTKPGIHTITATVKDWGGNVVGQLTANKVIFDENFYGIDEILNWYQQESVYDYNGKPRPVKPKDGEEVPAGFSVSWPYFTGGDEIQP
ncbi:hypothetical protein [Myroides pelagicus]|uniref:Uncharacterized protein n=1 Tax=Myroides pelagicus TaxID=270914 RepID=A0A7K1GSI8_9FLAO|nr:hypothetical protein [Myroides pelagicus]MEC4114664.1 hypothetical protein [Myroides pelagicus]MTH30834.1 hypothetical protein [Myroides pelagicus]